MTRRHATVLTYMVFAATAIYATIGLVEFFTFRTGVYDLVIFDQVVRDYSNFTFPGSIVKGQWNHIGVPLPIFSDHVSPILVLLAPLYWIYDGPETLLIAQSFLFAAAIPWLWVFTHRILGTPYAYVVACSYALCWPIAEAAAFQFHEFAFMPLLTAMLFERWQSGRRVHIVVICIALLMVKEDVGFLVAGFGLALLFRNQWRRLAFLIVAVGIGYTMIATRLIIPAFGGNPYRYWAYSGFGSNFGEAFNYALANPIDAVKLLFSPVTKVETMLWLLAPLAFMSLASPLVLTAIPMLLIRMAATDLPSWWGTHYHYNSAIVIPIFAAAVDGMARIARLIADRWPHTSPETPKKVWAVFAFASTLLSIPVFAYSSLFDQSFYTGTQRQEAAVAAISLIPDGALVEAANQLGPTLSAHTNVVIWRDMPRRAPWIIADTVGPQPMFSSLAAQSADVEMLRRCGYKQLFNRDGYVVLYVGHLNRFTPNTAPYNCSGAGKP